MCVKYIKRCIKRNWGFPDGSMVKIHLQCRRHKRCGFNRWEEEKEMANPLQYSFLESSMDRGARQATVHAVTESDMSTQAHTHNYKELAHMVMEAGVFEDLQGK